MDWVPIIIPSRAPSYIKDLTGCDEEVLLIYRKVDMEKQKLSPKIEKEEINDSLDLTGNPLEVDLNAGDCTLNVSVSYIANLWHNEEAEYGSLDVKTVRKLINAELTKRNMYIYGLCNGKDKDKTVILGGSYINKTFSRTQVCIKGIFKIDDKTFGIDAMKIQHCKNAKISCGPNIKIAHVVKGTYVFFGHKIVPSPSLLSSQYSGSILCEASWTTFRCTIPQCVDSSEMTIQVIVGHNESQLAPYFKELMLLRSYINLLAVQKSDLGSVVLNESSKDYMDIVYSITTAFSDSNDLRGPPPRMEKSGLNFNSLRRETLTDKLWHLLTNCKTVNDLRLCFHSLFEDLVTLNSPLNAKDFPAHDKSFISKILMETSNRRIAVPTLSHTQALACLIELGVEKLKRDYFYILNCANCLSEEQVVEFWESGMQEDKPLTATNITSKSSTRGIVGRARLTVDPTMAIIGFQQSFNKYKRLLSMHVAADVLALAMKFSCLEQCLADKVKYCLLHKQIKVNPQSNPLFEVTYKSDNKLKNMSVLNPIALNIKFFSGTNKDAVETIFHCTTTKLFPPVVYDSYDIPDDFNSKSYYYVTHLARYVKKSIL